MDRPEHVTCIRKMDEHGRGRVSLCGRSVPLEFMYQGVDHAFLDSERGGRLTVCGPCALVVVQVFSKYCVHESQFPERVDLRLKDLLESIDAEPKRCERCSESFVLAEESATVNRCGACNESLNRLQDLGEGRAKPV